MAMLKLVDEDGSGEISFEEFCAGLTAGKDDSDEAKATLPRPNHRHTCLLRVPFAAAGGAACRRSFQPVDSSPPPYPAAPYTSLGGGDCRECTSPRSPPPRRLATRPSPRHATHPHAAPRSALTGPQNTPSSWFHRTRHERKDGIPERTALRFVPHAMSSISVIRWGSSHACTGARRLRRSCAVNSGAQSA